MKKLTGIILGMILVFSLCACGNPGPTDVANDFMAAVKSQDAESLKTVYPASEIDLLDEFDHSEGVNNAALQEVYEKQLKPRIFDFDYEISNEKISENKATVDVAITTYNLGDAFTAFVQDYLRQAFSMAFSGSSEKEIEDKSIEILSEKLTGMEKNYTGTATLSLSMSDDGWVIDKLEDDGDFYNILTGGMGDASKKMNDSLSGIAEK